MFVFKFWSWLTLFCNSSGCGRSRESHVMEPLVLYLDLDVQLSVLVPNLLMGATNVDMGRETVLDTQRRLSLIHDLSYVAKHGKRLWIKVWSTMLFIWFNMNTSWVPMVSEGCVCHANITSSLNFKWTWCGSHKADTSAQEFRGGFLCRTWGICHCINWLS
jgi:hypothetical protein